MVASAWQKKQKNPPSLMIVTDNLKAKCLFVTPEKQKDHKNCFRTDMGKELTLKTFGLLWP